MHAERDLVITIVSARHRESQVIEDPLAEALHEGKPMGGREIDTRLPFRGVISAKRRRRSPELHGYSSPAPPRNRRGRTRIAQYCRSACAVYRLKLVSAIGGWGR